MLTTGRTTYLTTYIIWSWKMDVGAIMRSEMSLDEKIRALSAGGMPRAEIARRVGAFLDMESVLRSDLNVADKIRALDAGGLPRAEIARRLHKRYQHVRNVLEADKLHAPKRQAPEMAAVVEAGEATGVEEADRPFTRSHRLSVEAGGLVRLPADVLDALQAGPGSVIIAEMQDDGLKLFSNRAAWDRVRAMVKELGIDPRRDLVAELIAERRAEAARDD